MAISGSVRLRPIRLALLVEPSDLVSIRRFMRLSTCIWGGRHNPIVTIGGEDGGLSRNGSTAKDLIDHFEPDVLVEAKAGMAESLGWSSERSGFGTPRVLPLNQFYRVENERWIEFPASLGIEGAMHTLYEREFRFQRRHPQSFLAFEPSEDAGAFFEAVVGTFPADKELGRFYETYCEVFSAEKVPADVDAYKRYLSDHYLGPHWVASNDLELHGGDGWHPQMFVFDPNNPADLVGFWNFRLMNRAVLPINSHWISDVAESLRQDIVANHRPLPGNSSGIMISTDVNLAGSLGPKVEGEFVRAMEGLDPQAYRLVNHDPNGLGGRGRFGRDRIIAAAESASFNEEITEGRYVKIPTPAPDTKKVPYPTGHWANVLRLESRWQDSYATAYPYNLWSPGYPRLLSGDPVTVTSEGVVSLHSGTIGYTLLEPQFGRDAVVGWLKTHNIEAIPSDAGRVAAEVIAAAGGLRGSGMYADAETLRLLNKMALSEREGDGPRKQKPDKAMPFAAIEQHFKAREARSFGYWNRLDHFLKQSVFRAGLGVQCPNCAHNNWYDPKSLDDRLTCARCLKTFSFPQSPDGLRRLNWLYRVVGPFAVPNFAQGGYSVALALRRLWNDGEQAFTWCTGLNLKPLNREIDFIAFLEPRGLGAFEPSKPPFLVLGEAKSFGREAVTQADIDGLMLVAATLPPAVLVMATLKEIEDYTEEELRILTEFAKWGRRERINGVPRNPVMVLTGTELLTDHDLRSVWKRKGGKAAELAGPAYRMFRNPVELAELTQQLYLGLPDFWEDLRPAPVAPPAAPKAEVVDDQKPPEDGQRG
ncbi:hypothetical protein [Devosia sp. SL43]|uniref:hypothetical protein n=1 Tax=Devosia sp. SL43 TaxID=2806348 RepID=UPI001F2C9A54|nr:hypothetical protein [Devosia sp. SL43]UJW85111.1 hypothetical protein IM737_17130 [Devosia sp. SL43]